MRPAVVLLKDNTVHVTVMFRYQWDKVTVQYFLVSFLVESYLNLDEWSASSSTESSSNRQRYVPGFKCRYNVT